MTVPVKRYIGYMALGMLSATALHSIHPSFARKRSVWGMAAGWQREIAIWDGTMGCYLVHLLNQDDSSKAESLVPALMGLNVQFAVNHLAAAYRGKTVAFHYLYAALNVVGFGLGLSALREAAPEVKPCLHDSPIEAS